MDRPSKSKPRLGIETLEAREVPATAVLGTDGTLLVVGTNATDIITIRQSSTALTVDGVSGSFARSAVHLVHVSSLGGADVIRLDTPGAAVTKPTVIRAGAGDDTVFGGQGNDYIDGEGGNDRIYGEGGNDRIAGDTGDDYLAGGAGNDQIAGGAGADSLFGGTGIDRLWGGDGFDEIIGGAGMDHVYDDFTAGVHVDDADYVRHSGPEKIDFPLPGKTGRLNFGWFDANMADPGLRRDARMDARDGILSRGETIDLFEQAADGPTVSTNEFNSLSALVHTNQVPVAFQGRYFGQKIIDGDPANQWFTGGADHREALGDLHAGDPSSHLQTLIDKWFLGKDLPTAKDFARTTTYGYQEAAGKLFVDEPAATDVRQGDVGDCYWMASLGAVAKQDPNRIRSMFTDNGDGTYTVRLYNNGKAEFVTVDTELPVSAAGKFVFANQGGTASDSANELWVALAEKAYAQANESGWTGQDGTNSYNGLGGALADGASNNDGINGGWPKDALGQITAANVTSVTTASSAFADIRAAFDAGRPVTFVTKVAPASDAVVGNHVYTMVGYNATNHTVTLRNPWGSGYAQPELLNLSLTDLRANFDSWQAAV